MPRGLTGMLRKAIASWTRAERNTHIDRARRGRHSVPRHRAGWTFTAFLMLAGLMPALPQSALPALAAGPTRDIAVSVQVARDEAAWPGDPANVPTASDNGDGTATVTAGAEITTFKWLISIDNTGDSTQPRVPGCSPENVTGNALLPDGSQDPTQYPASCDWTSIRSISVSAPVFAQGNGPGELATALGLLNDSTGGHDGKYLISVLSPSFKLDGTPFTIPMESDAGSTTATVVVPLQPNPIPTSTVRAEVFADMTSANGQYDPGEQGIDGFIGHLADYAGEVTTDVYGNPLCTEYSDFPGGTPVPGTGGECVSHCYNEVLAIVPADPTTHLCPVTDPVTGGIVQGMVVIPNVGTNRFAMSVQPPNASNWVQTTTLEGNHDWDVWVPENSTGFDTEFAVGAEPVPTPIFGFASNGTTSAFSAGSNQISGVVVAAKVYVPTNGGLEPGGTIYGGLRGAKFDHVIDKPWIAITDLNNGDQTVWVGQGDSNGAFTVNGIADGSYQVTYWDQDQNYILDLQQVTVSGGEMLDMGTLALAGWWTYIDGYVFNDTNRNGKKDPGEPGISGFPVSIRTRENRLIDRGATTVFTDPNGYYKMVNVYPLTQWLVMEAYSDSFYTTGVTYQADNQPTPTTLLGNGVDLAIHPVIGLSGTVDWGVHAYDPTGTNGIDPQNGGIVGTVSYGTTRNELDPQYSAFEDWQPGIPGFTMNLYKTIPCGTHPTAPCDADGLHELNPDGSYARSSNGIDNDNTPMNDTVTGDPQTQTNENFTRPTDCTPRGVDGTPLAYPTDQQLTPPFTGGYDCIEAPLMGVQFGNDFQTVDGNWGFGDLAAGDYLVEAVGPKDEQGKDIYQVVREEDINIFNGDQYTDQTTVAVPPPACAGALHTVDVAGYGNDGVATTATFQDSLGNPVNITAPANPVDNAPYATSGEIIFHEGEARPLCNVKLVELNNGKSVAPAFEYFTPVPLPGKLWGLIVDDLQFSTDPKNLNYGEKQGVPNAPVGVYDYANRLITTVQSDPNGLYEVLLPSTDRISCPTPSGVCPNVWRLVGNDPGVPGRLNPDYNPLYRTISADFEVFPGSMIPADLAPTQTGVIVQLPGGQRNQVSCALAATSPQLLAVDTPVFQAASGGTLTIQGTGFGASTGQVMLGTTAIPTTSWSDTTVVAGIPSGMTAGVYQLDVVASNGEKTVNGLSIHILGTGYNPTVFEVGPGRAYDPGDITAGGNIHALQQAVTAAEAVNGLVVVYPGTPTADVRFNPLGAYYENIVITRTVAIQGVGPGGFQGNTYVPGSILDGVGFAGDTVRAEDWLTLVGGLTWDGNQAIFEGPVVSILTTDGGFDGGRIDGLDIRGGNQQDFPANINVIGGGPTGQPVDIQVQGGGLYANAYARNLQVTNNVFDSNGGAYAGAIRVGTPNVGNNNNTGVVISKNRMVANGGTNLAGAIGLFTGSNNYQISHNDICGNFSAEYGGGISVYGYSPNGMIDHNRIWNNASYDEGAGIFIAGELPANPSALSDGSGPATISNNLIQANLASDDGGGIRFLMVNNARMDVFNNMIVNNVSTHEGGGIALDDATNVRVFNNTIMKNLTTATAVTSNGLPAPAGLSTAANSDALQATLPVTAPTFSNPVLFNNIFWDNRAGTYAGNGTVSGIGLPGDGAPVYRWDMGTADGSGVLSPTNSVLQTTTGTLASSTNTVGSDPLVIEQYDTTVSVDPWRTNPNFAGTVLVAVDLPPNQMGDYHLSAGSPAIDRGVGAKGSVTAPGTDIDGDLRNDGFPDAGADESTGLAAFPLNATVLDTFYAPQDQNLSTANWSGQTTGFDVKQDTVLDVQSGGTVWWNEVFGPNQEAFFTFTQPDENSPNQSLLLKFNGTALNSATATWIRVRYSAASGGRIIIQTRTPDQGVVTHLNMQHPIANGQQFGARATRDGTVSVYLDGVKVAEVNVTSGGTPWPTVLAQGGGHIGLSFLNSPGDALLNAFGGGSIP